MPASKVLSEILRLDPKENHQRIVHLSFCYDFPKDMNRALEFALFRTFAVPSVSALLDSTGEFHCRPQKRYDDTGLLLAEMLERGYDSERGTRALRRMNQIHHRFEITNDDYLYVLSTFIYEPIRWNEKYGWRLMSEPEKLAMFYFWCEVGQRMGIRLIPESYQEFEKWSLQYEDKHFSFTESNKRVALATRNLFLGWYPKFLHPLIKQAIYSLLDDPVLKAFGFPKPNSLLKKLVQSALKMRAWAIRHLPRRKHPFHYTSLKRGTYPSGYRIEELGPPGT